MIDFTLGMVRWNIRKTKDGLYRVWIKRRPEDINKKKQVINWVQLEDATLQKAEEYISKYTRKSIETVQAHTRGG